MTTNAGCTMQLWQANPSYNPQVRQATAGGSSPLAQEQSSPRHPIGTTLAARGHGNIKASVSRGRGYSI